MTYEELPFSGIATFFKLIASLQIFVWIVLALDAVGVHVPILREVLVLVYLLFVPGIILLRVLRLHELSVTEGFFYTVGLSVATIMLTGLFMNTVYVHGITSMPLTLVPFIATMSGVAQHDVVLTFSTADALKGSKHIKCQLKYALTPLIDPL